MQLNEFLKVIRRFFKCKLILRLYTETQEEIKQTLLHKKSERRPAPTKAFAKWDRKRSRSISRVPTTEPGTPLVFLRNPLHMQALNVQAPRVPVDTRGYSKRLSRKCLLHLQKW